MSDSPSKKVTAFMHGSSQDLQLVFSKIKQLAVLNKKVAKYLGGNLSQYCQVANLNAKRLVFLAANGSTATELRLQSADLLIRFRQDPDLCMVQTIECKVRPANLPARFERKIYPKVARLSKNTAQEMEALAENLQDQKLKDILRKIAKHTD